MINEIKELGREELQDEILSIIFNYLITENEKKDKIIQQLWKEKTRGDKNELSKDLYLRRIKYLEDTVNSLQHKNEMLDQLVDDLIDEKETVNDFIIDRMIELSNCKDKIINTHLVFNMFKTLHNILDVKDD